MSEILRMEASWCGGWVCDGPDATNFKRQRCDRRDARDPVLWAATYRPHPSQSDVAKNGRMILDVRPQATPRSSHGRKYSGWPARRGLAGQESSRFAGRHRRIRKRSGRWEGCWAFCSEARKCARHRAAFSATAERLTVGARRTSTPIRRTSAGNSSQKRRSLERRASGECAGHGASSWPRPAADGGAFELVLVKAMVGAARADGPHRRDRAAPSLQRSGAHWVSMPSAKAYVFDLLTQPVSLESISGADRDAGARRRAVPRFAPRHRSRRAGGSAPISML